VVVFVLPLSAAVALATTDHSGITDPQFVGLHNLRLMAADDRWWTAVRTTLLVIAVTTPLRLALATGLALLLHTEHRGARVARLAVLMPMLLPAAAVALLWSWLLNPRFGPLGAGLAGTGLPTDELLTTPGGARLTIALVSLLHVGEAFIVVLAARSALGRPQYEAAALAGASSWRCLRRLTLPQLAPVLLLLMARDVVVVLQAAFTANQFITDGGPRGTSAVVPFHLYVSAFEHFRLGYASFLGVVSVLTCVVLAAVAISTAQRLRVRVQPGPPTR
jgi:ABC-type sugar transport system permease subunit